MPGGARKRAIVDAAAAIKDGEAGFAEPERAVANAGDLRFAAQPLEQPRVLEQGQARCTLRLLAPHGGPGVSPQLRGQTRDPAQLGRWLGRERTGPDGDGALHARCRRGHRNARIPGGMPELFDS